MTIKKAIDKKTLLEISRPNFARAGHSTINERDTVSIWVIFGRKTYNKMIFYNFSSIENEKKKMISFQYLEHTGEKKRYLQHNFLKYLYK